MPWHPSISKAEEAHLGELLPLFCALASSLQIPPHTISTFTSSLLPLTSSPLEVLTCLHNALDAFHQKEEVPSEGLFLDLAHLALQGPYPRQMIARGVFPGPVSAYPDKEESPSLYDTRLCNVLEEGWASFNESDEQGWFRFLRHIKHRESLLLFAREVQGTPPRVTTSQVSMLANALLSFALRWSARRQGGLDLVRDVAIVGMGKLGGEELNYGSDVDVVFLCSEGAFHDPARRSDVEAMLRHLIDTFTRHTSDGTLFRVDLRLRPEGTQGLLVQPVNSIARYLLQWGRTWERSAWLKASWSAGNQRLVDDLLEQIKPFLYRRSLDFNVLDELKQMKHMVQAQATTASIQGAPPPKEPSTPKKKRSLLGASRRLRLPQPRAIAKTTGRDASSELQETQGPNLLGWDAKIGHGGIREVEFFVQALLLVHSGRQPVLRVRGTLRALDALLYLGLITPPDHTTLSDAYLMYRKLEHQVQMHEERQTHQLPHTEEALDDLAKRMGQVSAEALTQVVLRHREDVHDIFSRLFETSTKTTSLPTLPDEQSTQKLWQLIQDRASRLDTPAVLAQLKRLGFVRPRQVAGQLTLLRQASDGPFGAFATTKCRQLGRSMVETCAQSPDPDKAMGFIMRLVSQVGASREWFWHMLADEPHAVRLLVFVFGASDFLATLLMRDVNVIRELFYVGSSPFERTLEEFVELLEGRLETIEDPEHRRGVIHKVHREETLRLAIHEMGGSLSVASVTRQLSSLAQVVVTALVHEVLTQWRPDLSLETLPFAIVAMGKWGGEEIDFGSDLDLVFLFDPGATWAREDAHKFATRVVRAISTTSDGMPLYAVDTRLRPSGNQGTLVVTFEMWQAYYKAEAAPWELQALLRSRVLPLGAPTFRARLERWREKTLRGLHKRPIDWRDSVWQMRQKLQDQATQQDPRFSVKAGSGGLLDLEFLAQCLQLVSHEPDTEAQHTVRALFVHQDAAQLAEDYWFLRRLSIRLRLVSPAGQGAYVPQGDEERAYVARVMGYGGEDRLQAFDAALTAVRRRVREALLAKVKPESDTV